MRLAWELEWFQVSARGKDVQVERVRIRYYIDPGTDLPHIVRHNVSENEIRDIPLRAVEDRPGKDGSRVAIGKTRRGRYLRVIYVPAEPNSVFVIIAYELDGKPLVAFRPPEGENGYERNQISSRLESRTGS